MKNKTLFLIWGGLFILCALLGFIPTPEGLLKGLLIFAATVFFFPGWILYYRGQQKQDLSLLGLLRGISLVSLATTFLFLVLFFLSAGKETAASSLLYGFLVIFSAPMICSQYWIASLFLWACLLIASFSAIRKAKKQLSQQ